ncbi:MAG: hypothetical protein FWB86_11185, partial [Treponema sp.]|nr:hypothetical protein [Treponema sp.]
MRVSNFLNYYYHPHSSSVANKLFFTLLFLILLTFLPLFFVSCSDIVALGTKIPVLVKPPYKVVANVIITAQPEKFIYTYGDTLDLTGLEVAIFYDYGDPAEIIKLADFEQYNITTSPAVGDILTFVDNNSQPIEITCKQVPAAAAADPELEDKSAKTWNLTVYKADQEVVWPVGLSGTIKQQLFEIDLSAHTNNGNGSFQWAEPGDRTYTSEAAMVGI